ncbi:hypothetical protein [Nocardia sp. NPDC056100]
MSVAPAERAVDSAGTGIGGAMVRLASGAAGAGIGRAAPRVAVGGAW